MTATSAVRVADALLSVEGLRTHFILPEGTVRAVDGVDLTVPAGKTVCVVGESGCGKSVMARSVLGLIDLPGKIVDGNIWWRGERDTPVDLASLDSRGQEIRLVRGGEIAMVFQEPIASLSPMYTVADHLIETIRLQMPMSNEEAWHHAVDLLRQAGIPSPERRMDAYPFQLSGGMCQRVMIAIALAGQPRLLIADEPTTALDVTTQARILDLIRDLQANTGMSIMFITHDLGVVAEIADEVIVMYLGTVVEQGDVDQIFHDPKHPYTKALLKSVPRMGTGTSQRLTQIRGQVPHPLARPPGCPFHPRCDDAIIGLCDRDDPPMVELEPSRRVRCVLHAPELLHDTSMRTPTEAGPAAAASLVPAAPVNRSAPLSQPLLDVRNLSVRYPIRGKGVFAPTRGHVHAVNGVDLTIHQGEVLGLVGESGCGKTTLGRCIVGIETPSEGSVQYRSTDDVVDLGSLSRKERRPYQQQIRMIFQDPFSSLNPRMTLLQIVGDPLRANKIATGTEVEDRVADMLSKVGLSPGHMHRYPHAFSGGQRQRINIARALILRPRLVVADEAVSALDVSVRAQILNLLRDLQGEFDLTYLFISHDLSVVESLCDRVAVMYLGRIAEVADTSELYRDPHHPYAEALLSAVPRPDPRLRDKGSRVLLSDEFPDPTNPPSGCFFHTRCPHADSGTCVSEQPILRSINSSSHVTACHHAERLDLVGPRPRVTGTDAPLDGGGSQK